jgi:transcriptional regulator with XRE-family HTH domain
MENSENIKTIIANRLRSTRIKKELSQGELAELLEIDGALLSKYEHGRRTIPFYVLVKIRETLGVTLDYMFGYTEEDKSGHLLLKYYKKLSYHDQQLAQDFVKWLGKRNKNKPEGEK